MISTASFHFNHGKDFLHDVDVKRDNNDGKYIIVTFGGLSKADYGISLFLTPEQALRLGKKIVHVVKNCEPDGTQFCERNDRDINNSEFIYKEKALELAVSKSDYCPDDDSCDNFDDCFKCRMNYFLLTAEKEVTQNDH